MNLYHNGLPMCRVDVGKLAGPDWIGGYPPCSTPNREQAQRWVDKFAEIGVKLEIRDDADSGELCCDDVPRLMYKHARWYADRGYDPAPGVLTRDQAMEVVKQADVILVDDVRRTPSDLQKALDYFGYTDFKWEGRLLRATSKTHGEMEIHLFERMER